MPVEVAAPTETLAQRTRPFLRRSRGHLNVVSEFIARAVTWKSLPWAIVTLGIILRLARYLHERSLWLDEALLSLNLLGRSFSHLTHTLDYDQGAPLGFLFGEKAVTRVLGDSEYSLRLLPFLAGVASMFAFYAAAMPLLRRGAFLVALLLFATLEPFIYYADTVKQYEFDVLVTLTLLALFVRLVATKRPLTRSGGLLLALAGAIAVWLSHPSVFVLTGFAVAMSLTPLLQREWRAIGSHLGIYASWLGSFAVTYFLSIRRLGGLQESLAPTTSAGNGPAHLLKGLYLIFSDPGMLPRTAVGLAFVVALAGLAVIGKRDWRIPLLITVAGAVAYLTAYLGKYPLYGRFVLFLLPVAVILVGAGLSAFGTRPKWLPSAAVLFGAAVLLVVPPVLKAAEHLVQPPDQEEIRPLLDYMSAHWQAGETLYVFFASQYALRYYWQCADCRGLTREQRSLWPLERARGNSAEFSPALKAASPHVIVGAFRGHDEMRDYLGDVRRLFGRGKVWLLFTHYFPLTQQDLLQPLDNIGRQVQCIHAGASIACLYDFRRRT